MRKELKVFDSVVEPFVPKNYGDVLSREDWLDYVKSGSFIPYDGTLGEIIIDNQLTCYELAGWGSGFGFGTSASGEFLFETKIITLEQFKELEGNVQVVWYNR